MIRLLVRQLETESCLVVAISYLLLIITQVLLVVIVICCFSAHCMYCHNPLADNVGSEAMVNNHLWIELLSANVLFNCLVDWLGKAGQVVVLHPFDNVGFK